MRGRRWIESCATTRPAVGTRSVATVPGLEGYDIRDYGNRLFRHWALGDKQRDDGVLLLVAPQERKVSIEVGYGAEPDLTDAISRIIIENAIVPRFKAGDYAGGITPGVDDIARALGGQSQIIVDRARSQSAPPLEDLLPLIFLIVIVFIIIANVSRGGRNIGTAEWPNGSYRVAGRVGDGPGAVLAGVRGGGGSSGGGGASGSW